MNHLHYHNAKRHLAEIHQQAYRDSLARSLTPSFRVRLANVLTKVAGKLEGKKQTEGLVYVPASKLIWVSSHATPVQIPGR
jgi:hypothetical protein